MNEELAQLEKRLTSRLWWTKMTTTSDAQFSAPSIAKSEHGGGHSSKVKVLPRLHKWTWHLILMTKLKQVVNASLHFSPHSRLFYNVHIFWRSLPCMIKFTMCNKLYHKSESHILASISFIPLLVLNSCGIINLGGSCLSCWEVWYNKIEVFLSSLFEHYLESFILGKLKTLSLTIP